MVAAMAVASWRLIEKPSLKLKTIRVPQLLKLAAKAMPRTETGPPSK
jgi:peptidoglycan/LPS O-acetylase OafA/YrhL